MLKKAFILIAVGFLALSHGAKVKKEEKSTTTTTETQKTSLTAETGKAPDIKTTNSKVTTHEETPEFQKWAEPKIDKLK